MSNETLFYIVGGSLTALALITSFAGLRWEKFPTSRGAFAGVVVVFLALVGATAAFGWLNGEDEQEHRNAEIAAGHLPSPEEALLEQGEAVQEPESEEAATVEGEQTTTPTEETASTEGAQLFADQGCAGCHTLTAADATGSTGPNLDETLEGKDPAYIEQAIVVPNETLADDFPPDIMPQNYEDLLSPEELDALVQYLSESTSGAGG
ncbi:MAG TPA: cytochrome c [Solirubrobacterales bacterium]|nr:cytochrome c [Solirubrobacterales bacterium]